MTEARGENVPVGSHTRRTGTAGADVELLIVGTYGGGGVHQYADRQAELLEDRLTVDSYDMVTPPTDGDLGATTRAVLSSVLAALVFPFRTPPDVVHVHSSHRYSFYRASFYALVAAYLWRTPVMFHVHGSSFDRFVEDPSPPVRALQSLVFDAVDEVIVLSPYWREVVAPLAGTGKVRVIPNAVDPGAYDPVFEASVPRFVFVSNLVERKGVRELAAAVESLVDRTDDPFEVTVAGRGPLSDRADALAAEHDNVEYLGYVSEAEKRRVLSEGTVFVLPTYAEGLPIAMLEGMAGGNAVVSTTVGSIPDVVGEENGVLVRPGDEGALASALERLLGDPERTEAMGRRNRDLVLERFTWEETADRLVDLYAEHVH